VDERFLHKFEIISILRVIFAWLLYNFWLIGKLGPRDWVLRQPGIHLSGLQDGIAPGSSGWKAAENSIDGCAVHALYARTRKEEGCYIRCWDRKGKGIFRIDARTKKEIGKEDKGVRGKSRERRVFGTFTRWASQENENRKKSSSYIKRNRNISFCMI